MPVVEASLTL